MMNKIAGPSNEPASLTLCAFMAKANSNATTIIAKITTAPSNSAILIIETDGIPITEEDARYVIANSNPPICNATPALVILATASHLPARSCNLEHGRHNNASKVPLSLSPAVMSIDG